MKCLDHKALLTSPSSLHAALKKDLDSMKSRYNEASDKLLEKNRQLQKLQVCIKLIWQSCTPEYIVCLNSLVQRGFFPHGMLAIRP